jgi:hypothetical protein
MEELYEIGSSPDETTIIWKLISKKEGQYDKGQILNRTLE